MAFDPLNQKSSSMLVYPHQTGVVPSGAKPSGGIILGGTCPFTGAKSPNNGLPLTQLALIDAVAVGLDPSGWGEKVSLLYSWKCGIFEGDFSYRVNDGAVEILEHASGGPDVEDFPYPDFPIIFPATGHEVRLLSQEERDQMMWINGLTEQAISVKPGDPLWNLSIPRHQFLGVPFLLDPNGCGKRCLQCSRPMLVFATIANQMDGFDDGFFGDDFVQLVYLACSECNILTARNFAG
jgi:hypothetical protein